MSRFLDLTDYAPELTPGHFDFSAREHLFPSVVADSSFRLWKTGDPIRNRGVRILLGVAVWSGYDTHLLDVIEKALASMNGEVPVVEVFNAGILTSQEAFADYIPQLGEVMQMPVVGVWRNGELAERASGYEARELVARMFRSSSDEIVNFVRNRHRVPAGTK